MLLLVHERQRAPRPGAADRRADRHHRAGDAAVGLPDRPLRRRTTGMSLLRRGASVAYPAMDILRARRRRARGRRQPPPRARLPVRARRRDRAAAHRRDLRLGAARRQATAPAARSTPAGASSTPARRRRAAPLDAPALRARPGSRHAPDARAPGAAGVREPDGAAGDRGARGAARVGRPLRADRRLGR